MNKFLSTLAIGAIIFLKLSCHNTDHADNPMLGKWKSLWTGSENKGLDFNLSFESNNTYHVEVYGGEAKPETVFGNYRIYLDTLMVVDKLNEPTQLCSYADTGKYTFKRHNDTLFLKVIKDLCEMRKLTLEMGLIKANDLEK